MPGPRDEDEIGNRDLLEFDDEVTDKIDAPDFAQPEHPPETYTKAAVIREGNRALALQQENNQLRRDKEVLVTQLERCKRICRRLHEKVVRLGKALLTEQQKNRED